MKIQPRDQTRLLSGNPFDQYTAIILYGPNEGKSKDLADQLHQKIVPKDDPFAYVPLTSDDIAQDPAKLTDELASGSLMGGQRLIHISDADDKTAKALKTALESVSSPENRILIQAGNLTPRSALRKFGEDDKQTAILAFYEETQASMGEYIRTFLQENGKTIDRDATMALQKYIGTNRQLGAQMLELLITYVGQQQAITLDDIQQCFQSDSAKTLDDIVRATLDQNFSLMDQSLLFLEQEGLSPVAILRALQSYFYRLRRAHSYISEGQPVDSAMKRVKPPVFFKEQDRFKQDLRAWPTIKIDSALNKLLLAEKQAKSNDFSGYHFLHRTLAMLGI